MSPVTTTQLVVHADEDEGGEVGVARDRDAERVSVTWFCGDRFSFTREDLADAIAHVERMAAFDDVWVELRDSVGKAFYVTVVDDELVANTEPRGGRRIPWDDLKKALRKMSKKG